MSKFDRKSVISTVAIALAFAGSLTIVSAPALAYDGQELASRAKITIAQARDIALQARPGKITDEELEREKGDGGLRYSFDVSSEGKSYEVGVDAKTGAILENVVEGPDPD